MWLEIKTISMNIRVKESSLQLLSFYLAFSSGFILQIICKLHHENTLCVTGQFNLA